MFSTHQNPKEMPYLEEKTGINSIISLQRYYNTEQEHETRVIPIRMDYEQDIVSLEQDYVKEHPSSTELNAISVVMDRDIKRALWVDDPLRLCLNGTPITLEQEVDSIPAPPPKEPAPPSKVLSSTPTIPPPVILPSELYEPTEHSPYTENPSLTWLYSRDQASRMSSTSTFFQDTQNLTDETWEAIFHPLSTFKHKKGELEYFAWNPSNLPAAAARVAQRVMNARAFVPESDILEVEATIPTLMPSPPPKPSPVLSENKTDEMTEKEEGYYFDMLKNIHGDEQSSLKKEKQPVARIAKRYILDMISTNKSKQHESYKMEDEKPITTQAMIMDPEICSGEKNRYWTEKRLFWFGFICPLLWFYGSYYIRAASKSNDPTNLTWQKRCRLASIYFSVILSVVVLITSVKAAGSAGIRQSQSGTIRAVIAN